MEGLVVGRFRITRKLDAGGMAEVYEAKHELMDRFAAVKFLRPEMSARETIVRRFFQEAQAAARIEHPGIVHVYDVGYTADRRAFLVMELLHGETLHQRLRREKTLPMAAAITVIRQLAGAMGAAHQRGIIHRDLKPDNIFLVRDPDMPHGERVKVLDFGLAKLLAVAAPRVEPTTQGTVFGTPAYMAPEQCRSAGEVDHRADLYAIGCIFYMCLCGMAPFGSGGIDVLLAHVSQEPVPPRQHVRGIPPAIEELILQLLAKDRDLRPPSCETLIAQLDRAVETLPDGLARCSGPQAGDEQTVRDNPTLQGALGFAARHLARMPHGRQGEPAATAARVESTQRLDTQALIPVDAVENAHLEMLAGPMAATVVNPDHDAVRLSEDELESVAELAAAARSRQPDGAHGGVSQPAESPGLGEDAARTSSPSLSNGELEQRPRREPGRRSSRYLLLVMAMLGCLVGLVAATLLFASSVDAPARSAAPRVAGQAQSQAPLERLGAVLGTRYITDVLAALAMIGEDSVRQARARVAEREAEVRTEVQRLLRRRKCKALARVVASVSRELPAMQDELQRQSADCVKAAASAGGTRGKRDSVQDFADMQVMFGKILEPRTSGRCQTQRESGRITGKGCRPGPGNRPRGPAERKPASTSGPGTPAQK